MTHVVKVKGRGQRIKPNEKLATEARYGNVGDGPASGYACAMTATFLGACLKKGAVIIVNAGTALCVGQFSEHIVL